MLVPTATWVALNRRLICNKGSAVRYVASAVPYGSPIRSSLSLHSLQHCRVRHLWRTENDGGIGYRKTIDRGDRLCHADEQCSSLRKRWFTLHCHVVLINHFFIPDSSLNRPFLIIMPKYFYLCTLYCSTLTKFCRILTKVLQNRTCWYII